MTALAPSSFAQVEGFEMTSGIPSDFFLVTGQRRNAENQFLCDNWSRVEQAFMDTGIVEDLMGMVRSENPDEVESMTQMFRFFESLAAEVDWSAFGDEMVFGQRLAVPVFSDNAIGAMGMGMPDMVYIFSSEEEVATKNYNGLVGLGNGALGMLGGMIGKELALETMTEHGIEFSVLDFSAFDADAPDFPISVGHKGGTLVFTIGAGLRSEVAALLAGVGDIRSINTNERFQNAFKGMPAAENSFEYSDMPNLTANMADIFDAVGSLLDVQLGGGDAGTEEGGMVSQEAMILDMVNQAMELGLEAMSLTQYTATVSYTVGATIHSESRVMLADDAKANRFYPLMASSTPMENFAAYLPATTTGYSVKCSQDLTTLYNFALELIGDFGPMGQMALGEWGKLQEQSGFDMRRDVLSWVGGETISTNFTIDGKDVWVTRMKVADEAQALEKLNMVMDLIPEGMKWAAKQNPMAAMMQVRISETRDERFPGFKEINMPMAGTKMLCGVKDGWLTFSASGDALAATELVAAGGAPNITTNEAMLADALIVGTPILAASFSDYSTIAPSIADRIEQVTAMSGMVLPMIEEPEVREIAMEVLDMVGRLVPVIEAIDFYRSGSSVTTFDGKAYHTHSITNYVAPAAK